MTATDLPSPTDHITKAHEYLSVTNLGDKALVHALIAIAIEARRMNDNQKSPIVAGEAARAWIKW